MHTHSLHARFFENHVEKHKCDENACGGLKNAYSKCLVMGVDLSGTTSWIIIVILFMEKYVVCVNLSLRQLVFRAVTHQVENEY